MSTAEAFLTGSVGAIPLRTAAVLDAIKHAILAGELRPGQSLVEAELAQRLGVSKTPVREALKTLAGAGLVTMSPYRGATVRAIDAETARSIYDMRLLLEPEAVRRAVLRAGAGGAAGLAAAGAALDRADAASDEAERSLANRDFHRALYLDCGNPLLVGVLDDLRDQTALVSAAAWQHEPSWRQEAGEHRAILAAAAAGDADHAARLVAAHIGSFAARHFAGAGHLPGPGRPGGVAEAPGTEQVQSTGSARES
ncbi:MAG TPA: GntR family transcriptional regulator [Streptosporangiaceae bacterium]|jgi:DNA-binding GntR family transcriptional regulator|nr:GntR family transcriptional regulator [Streptosporangiaceae bacterium]